MLINKLEQWKQGFYKEGREEGWEVGRQEGREEGREEIVLAMHARDFDQALIAEITG